MPDENKYTENQSLLTNHTMANAYTPTALKIAPFSRVGFIVDWANYSGSAADLTIQVSNDGTKWYSYESITINVSDKVTGKNYADLGWTYIRFLYSHTSVTAGTLNITYSTKTL